METTCIILTPSLLTPHPLTRHSLAKMSCSGLVSVLELLTLSGFTLVAMTMTMLSAAKALAVCAKCGQERKVRR